MTNLTKKIAIMAVAAPLAVTLTAGCVPKNPVMPAPVQRAAEVVSAPAQVRASVTSNATSTPTKVPVQAAPAPAVQPPAPAQTYTITRVQEEIIYVDNLPQGVCETYFQYNMGQLSSVTKRCGR